MPVYRFARSYGVISFIQNPFLYVYFRCIKSVFVLLYHIDTTSTMHHPVVILIGCGNAWGRIGCVKH